MNYYGDVPHCTAENKADAFKPGLALPEGYRRIEDPRSLGQKLLDLQNEVLGRLAVVEFKLEQLCKAHDKANPTNVILSSPVVAPISSSANSTRAGATVAPLPAPTAALPSSQPGKEKPAQKQQ